MAKIEIADLGVLKTEHANISDVVGVGEKNEKNDVMLVQALFALVGYNKRRAKEFFGLDVKDLPEPTGVLDEKTIRAIWGLQRNKQYRLRNTDGKIHPASYQNRVLKRAYKGERLMVITLLNIEGVDGALMDYNASLTEALKIVAPQLIFT